MVIQERITQNTKHMQKYEFQNPSLWKGVSAETAAAELERIRQKHGILKPELVVEESRSKKAVLHKCFQWDDAKAAEAWRTQQARTLIGNIYVVVTDEQVSCRVRALVNVSTAASPGRSYIPITEAIHDDAAYKDLLAQAKEEMSSFVGKYNQIAELNPVKAEMLKAIAL